MPSGPHGVATRNAFVETGADGLAAAAAAIDAAVGGGSVRPPQSAIACAYCVFTRCMMCCADVSSRRRNGAG